MQQHVAVHDRNAAPRVVVGGVPVTRLNRTQWVEKMIADWHAARDHGAPPKFSTTAKGQTMSLIRTRPDFRDALAKADSIAPDGVPILWGARYIAGWAMPERIATTDVFHDFARAAEREGISFYLFGGTKEVNAQALARVRELFPNLKIAGARHGFFAQKDEAAVIAEIVATKPDIVWVGLGIPSQELFVARTLHLWKGVTWVKTCGGLFDFLAGRVSRAPEWMQRAGLEWVYRVWLEPRRLFWRYLTTTPHGLYRMLVATPRVEGPPSER
jgi:N-acetylglucosaminyldiphosphoundecaprenol N-acetyl-beta-D-mannosaminyltransferase